MVYKYIRYSTNKQDERQQDNTITNYLNNIGIKADSSITDEATSGGIDYDKRKLGDLCNSLKPNDTLVISELSRLTRGGISELNTIITTHFAPNKLRLIICNVGLDVNCSNLNPLVELQLAMLATFAKIEKIQIQDRTKSALDVRKRQIEDHGFFITKKGRRCEKLGGNNMTDEAREKACAKKMSKAANDPENVFFASYIRMYEKRTGNRLTADSKKAEFEAIAIELNALGKKTKTGLDYDANRTRALWVKMREREMKLNAYKNRKED